MSNLIIRSTLETKLKTMAAAMTPPVPIAYQSVAFTRPTGATDTYYECFLIPSTTLNKELSGKRKTMYGIFQVNCWARVDLGMGPVEKLGQAVVDAFPMIPKSGVVSIENTPTLERSILDNAGWVCVPVTIKYRYESVS
jgi:hypothetical protein